MPYQCRVVVLKSSSVLFGTVWFRFSTVVNLILSKPHCPEQESINLEYDKDCSSAIHADLHTYMYLLG